MSAHAGIPVTLVSELDHLATALHDVASYLEGTGAAWEDSPYCIFDRSALRRRIGPVFNEWLRLKNCLDQNIVFAIDPSFQKIFGDTKCIEWETGGSDPKVGLIPRITLNPKGNVYLYNESIRQFCRGVRSLPHISVEQVESIDSIIPFLSDSDKQVFQTIHDFEHKPYPTEPEQLEGGDEMYAPQPKSITPVPWYFLKGAHWPVDPSPSLLALTRFGLIRQPNGVYHRSVHCRLPTGRVLRVEYKLTRTAAAGDGKPSHFVVVYVDGRDEFCEDSATWVSKPNAYELTTSGLRVARKLFSSDCEGAKEASNESSQRDDRGHDSFRILHDQFAVEFDGKRCKLGIGLQFKLLERLARRIGRYVAISDLASDVWNEPAGVEKNAIQAVVTKLRKALKEAGLEKAIRIDGKQAGYYRVQVGPMIDD